MDDPQTEIRVDLSTVLEAVGFALLLIAAAAFDWRLLVALVGLGLIAVSYLIGK